MNSDFDRLRRAYRRLSADTGARMNFACDVDADAVLAVAEEEKSYLDQAFFVLAFGVLERQVNGLATARIDDPSRRHALRDSKFDQRLNAAIRVATEVLGEDDGTHLVAAKEQILDWYSIRSDLAHGEPPSGLLDIVGVLERAEMNSVALRAVAAALGREDRS